MNENFYQYTSLPCINLYPNFYCTTDEIQNGSEDKDCIFHLLQISSTQGNCQHTPIQIVRDVIQQIDESHYIAIFPNQTKIQTICYERNDFRTLQGNYLIKLPFGCQFQTNHRTFVNEKITISGQPMLLPEVKVPHSLSEINLPKITIKDVPLDKIHKLQKEQNKVEQIELIHHEKPINYWTIPVYIIIILIGLYYAYKSIFKKLMSNQRSTPTTEGQPPEASPQAFFTP